MTKQQNNINLLRGQGECYNYIPDLVVRPLISGLHIDIPEKRDLAGGLSSNNLTLR